MATLPVLDNFIECTCKDCVSACYKKPGWFLPEEIKPAADLLGLTEQEFFDRYLMVDYFLNPDQKQFVLSPAIVGSEPGKEFPLDPSGQCVFLKNDLCSIHGAKPYECKYLDHRENHDPNNSRHQAVAETWIPHQDKITELLGREAKVDEPNELEAFSFIFKMLQQDLQQFKDL